MRKSFLFAGMILAAALLFAQPSKADSVVQYEMTGHGLDITFTLPQTFVPTTVNQVVQLHNISGTLFPGGHYLYGTLTLALTGNQGVTNYWYFGSIGPEFGLIAPGLFTVNPDGTITLNPGTWALGDYHLFLGQNIHDYQLTATVVNTVGTPEPASLALLGIGGLALVGLRRRKTA
jgi:PEP-CTERM motif